MRECCERCGKHTDELFGGYCRECFEYIKKDMRIRIMDDEPDTSTREGILEAAKQCVCTDREGQYGSPEDNFASIAKMWSEYLRATTGKKIEVRAHDVAVMMCLLKIARIATGEPKADSWIDLAGYAACGGEIQANQR